MIDQKELDEIEQRANRATPWPWNLRGAEIMVADGIADGVMQWRTGMVSRDDLAFAVNARWDVPLLIAEIKRLRAIESIRDAVVIHDRVMEIVGKERWKVYDFPIDELKRMIEELRR